jgi:hypothetical protein
MLATERLIEIELLCSGKAHHIEVIESDGEYLKIVIYFNDDSNLRVAELWEEDKLTKYSYYWLSSTKELKIGWDNAPHHKKVETFPHHMHRGDKRVISSSSQNCLEDVIAFIFSEERFTK